MGLTGRPPGPSTHDGTAPAQGAVPCARGLTRRGALSGAALLGANAALAGLLAPSRASAAPSAPVAAVPFYGPHQAGIATAAQDYLHFAAFDLEADDGPSLRDLLRVWTEVAVRLTRGATYEPQPQRPDAAPQDTGEAIGLGPAGLTLTFGLGPALFAQPRAGRLGIAGRRPHALRELPAFAGERLDPTSSDGDLCVQACAEDPQVAFHAVHELARASTGAARLRYAQQGFGRTSATARGQATERNLLGFKDGTDNLRAQDTEAMEEFVWVKPGEAPRWMAGGTYLILRRIRMLFSRWDRQSLEAQERTIGRQKLSGAPLGRLHEYEPLDLRARAPDGQPVIPADAHVRLASPAENRGRAILRRGYSYGEGVQPGTGEIDAGLYFICFARDPARQFVPLQHRLAQADALSRFTLHTASALFACPPGALPGGFVGELLFD